MVPDLRIDDVLASTAVGTDGELGPVGDVYVDDVTGLPEWATVRTGAPDGTVAVVPLTGAELVDGRLHVPYDTATVSAAPHLDSRVEGNLSAVEEADLYRHYGLDVERSVAAAVGTARGPEPTVPEPGDRVSGGAITAETPASRLRRWSAPRP